MDFFMKKKNQKPIDKTDVLETTIRLISNPINTNAMNGEKNFLI